MTKQELAIEVLSKLKKHYPNVETALHYSTPFQLLMATILSAQCTDERVNKVTPGLFKEYPDPQTMAKADIEKLKELIHSTGFYNNKAKNILGAAQMIVAAYQGEVPQTMPELLKLPGVARKTANVVLSNVFNIHEGIAVDTHVKRISRLIGLTKEKNPDKIEKDLMELFPREEWGFVSLAIIQYGRDYCPARKHEADDCFLGHGETT